MHSNVSRQPNLFVVFRTTSKFYATPKVAWSSQLTVKNSSFSAANITNCRTHTRYPFFGVTAAIGRSHGKQDMALLAELKVSAKGVMTITNLMAWRDEIGIVPVFVQN